ncbi:MAG: ABC transporter permease [Alphaproteobacteria bacterium]|nr:ABC transporter permease [Alphaproteobacteria bacterium]NCQ66772.1 ABC transporter permease [Alphaproteobacteria bacterium]NCT07340.1 ABC transporter permease [Alphaproteobacteria bacterium]
MTPKPHKKSLRLKPAIRSLYRLRGLVRKELFQIIRDPSSILIAFVLPLMLIFLFGYALNLDANNLRVGLVVEQSSPTANQLSYSFINSQNFNVTYGRSLAEVKDQVRSSELRGVILIPENFDRDFKAQGSFARLQVIADGSEPNTASLLQNYARATYQGWFLQHTLQEGVTLKPPIRLEPRVWYNPAGISRFFLLPGSIAVIMTIIGTLLTALVIAREWERGTMEAMLVTPLRVSEILLGKLVPYFILGIGSLLVCLLLSIFIFSVPFRGSLWLLLLVSSLFLISALGLGLLISTLAKNQFIASQAALYSAFLPAFLLSGFIFEIESMPDALQKVTFILPARYFVQSLKTLFLAGDVYTLIALNASGIILMGALFLFIAKTKIRKRLD